MTKLKSRVHPAAWALSLAASLSAQKVSAQSGAAPFAFDHSDEEPPFQPGHSCAELAFLSEGELKEALSLAFQADFPAFCFPEEPQSCGDYAPMLRGMGRFVPGEDGYHCRYLPAKG
jgi:hypothetical protein